MLLSSDFVSLDVLTGLRSGQTTGPPSRTYHFVRLDAITGLRQG
jgi:hypothetical protein